MSFRQYPSFSSGLGPQQQQPSQNDNLFMSQQSQLGQHQFDKLKPSDYSNRSNMMQSGYGGPHGLNLQNSIMNQQQQQQQQQNPQQVKSSDYYSNLARLFK